MIVEIGRHRIGADSPCFIIAEVGVNHNGSLEMAKKLVDAAVGAGADAVKFQTFKAERLVAPDAPKAGYQLQSTDASESQLDMLRRLELRPDAHVELMKYCQEQDILFMSTPFDEKSSDLLAELAVTVYKIPSGEITNWPFLEHVARKGKPIILSTGMSFLSEVAEAVRVFRDAGCDQLVLLHCTSNYPANPVNVNLRAMQTMATAFQKPVGYSDHTLGIEVAIAAVALGASVIEKHFTLDRKFSGPDHQASLEPDELEALVRGIRIVEASLGHGRKEPAASEADTAAVARKSLVAAQDIPSGTILTEQMIAVKRPGTGLPPSIKSYLVGRTVQNSISEGTLFSLEALV